MASVVVDTSALLLALSGESATDALTDRLGESELHAPHLIDTEFLHALRRLVARNELSEDRADDLRGDLADLPILRYPHEPLNNRVWKLRNNLTAYDATFVALAEVLGVPLITADSRLANAPGNTAQVEVYS